MKLRKLLFFAAVAVSASSAFAQKGVEDGSKYGHGQDSINCLNNLSVYTQYVKTNNMEDAYLPWKAVMEECPLAQLSTYLNGVKIMSYKLQKEKDPAKYQQYFDELMKTFDLRMKYFGTYKSRPAIAVLGDKAYYYTVFCPKDKKDAKLVYGWFAESVKAMKDKSEYLMHFVAASADVYKLDPNTREQFIADYLFASENIDKAIANSKGAKLESNKTLKDNINAYFINSGVAECENLQQIYAPQVEQHKSDLEQLRGILRVMELVGCVESDAYFQASFYAHQIEPTSESALGCAAMSVKKGEYDAAVNFYQEALDLEKDNLKKSEIAYKAAAVLYVAGKYTQSRTYARKAIEYNKSYGAPYILIANLYASNPRWSDEPALNALTYCLVVDKLQMAKSVDPSVAEEATKLINRYASHYPETKDLFMLGYTSGQSIQIGGWIGETTTVRCR